MKMDAPDQKTSVPPKPVKLATLITEEPVIAFSYIAAEALTTKSLQELYTTLSRMGRATNQGEIGLVLDGRYYGITTYAEE